jgi:Mg2+ and Co2+ transporter CorA
MSYLDLLRDMLEQILSVLNEQMNFILDLLSRVTIG